MEKSRDMMLKHIREEFQGFSGKFGDELIIDTVEKNEATINFRKNNWCTKKGDTNIIIEC